MESTPEQEGTTRLPSDLAKTYEEAIDRIDNRPSGLGSAFSSPPYSIEIEIEPPGLSRVRVRVEGQLMDEVEKVVKAALTFAEGGDR